MHPAERIRGSWSSHLEGRTIVLGVAGSIAAVRSVELARVLIRHGAQVRVVMTGAALGIVTPDALEFATGAPPVTRLTGQVEHVTWLGEEGDADLLLVAPATANTIAKIALGIDDTPVTTCAQVAIGAGRPVLIAPAMHGVMEDNPATRAHVAALQARGVVFVAPLYEEAKAKLAVDEAVAAVLRALGPGTLTGKRVLLVTGRSEEPVDTVRVLSNRSSGRTGRALAAALHRHGAELTILASDAETTWPPGATLEHYTSLESLFRIVKPILQATEPDWILVPAALADFVPESQPGKMKSGGKVAEIRLTTARKLLPYLREAAPAARIVGWKLEDDLDGAARSARKRLEEYGIDAVVANATQAMGSDAVEARLVLPAGEEPIAGSKHDAMEHLVAALARHLARAARSGAPRGGTKRPREAA